MKKPILRGKKWLGNIPVEAQCSLCSMTFRAQSTSPRPTLEEYQKSLEAQFKAHTKDVHPETPST